MASRFDCEFDEEHFECADAGAADTFPVCAGDLKRGDLVCIRGRPCKILENDVVKVGKHGHTKACIEGEDIFTGRKYELVAPGSFGLPAPVVKKSEFSLIDIHEDNSLSLLDEHNEMRNDLDLPMKENESLARAIRAHFDNGKSLILIAHKAMGIEAILAFKFESNGR